MRFMIYMPALPIIYIFDMYIYVKPPAQNGEQ